MKEVVVTSSKADKVRAGVGKMIKKMLMSKNKDKTDNNGDDIINKIKANQVLKTSELIEALSKRNLSTAGSKSEMIDRIKEAIPESENDSLESLEKMKASQLKDILRKRGLPVSGKKSDMIERIVNKNAMLQSNDIYEGIETLNISDLKRILSKHGLSMTGKKSDLIDRIKTCIPYAPYVCPENVSYADDHGCGNDGTKFSLELASTSSAFCRRCLEKIDQGRIKICYSQNEYVSNGIFEIQIESKKCFHAECFAAKPPRGIADYSDIKFCKHSTNEEHHQYLRDQFANHHHSPESKDTPRVGGTKQALRVQQVYDGKQINGREAVGMSLDFFDELEG